MVKDNEIEVMHEKDREIEKEDVLPILHDIDINLKNNMND